MIEQNPGRLRLGFFWIRFLIIQALLFGAEMLTSVQRLAIEPFNHFLASLSAGLMQVFDASVYARDGIIWNTHTLFGIEILAGCNAVEASILLIAAILAFPAPWRHKLKGLAYGLLALHLLNLVRIISLFYLGQWSDKAFEWAHLYIWQALIMLDAVVVWLLWMYKMPGRAGSAGLMSGTS